MTTTSIRYNNFTNTWVFTEEFTSLDAISGAKRPNLMVILHMDISNFSLLSSDFVNNTYNKVAFMNSTSLWRFVWRIDGRDCYTRLSSKYEEL